MRERSSQHDVETLKAAVWSKGITQESLAKALGIDRAAMSKRLNGVLPMRPAMAQKIAALLGIELPKGGAR